MKGPSVINFQFEGKTWGLSEETLKINVPCHSRRGMLSLPAHCPWHSGCKGKIYIAGDVLI